MNYYNEIKDELLNNEINRKVKNYAINRSDLNIYYNVGKILTEASKHYGESIIKEYARKLTRELGKEYNLPSLNKIRQFFILSEKLGTMSHQLSYAHYVELLPYEDINKIKYYLKKSEKENLSIKSLQPRIKSNEYEKLDEEEKNKLINSDDYTIADFVKNPLLIKNNRKCESISEKVLQKLILEDLPSFLKKLGSDFSFIDNEYKIKLGDEYNYIDLLLYNIKYKCYVVVELKVVELNSAHITQIQNYMNYIDEKVKSREENFTVGIIISHKENKYVVKYCSDKRIISGEYILM